jgi:hypothetical protein
MRREGGDQRHQCGHLRLRAGGDREAGAAPQGHRQGAW